jgi:hypothetical protein
VIPAMRINSLKSLAMNWGPLSEMIRGFASGYFSRARCKGKSRRRGATQAAREPAGAVETIFACADSGRVIQTGTANGLPWVRSTT